MTCSSNWEIIITSVTTVIYVILVGLFLYVSHLLYSVKRSFHPFFRKKLEKLREKEYGSQKFWDERSEDHKRNKNLLRTMMKRSQSAPSVSVEERRQNLVEATRSYQHQLAEMRRR